MKPYRLIIFDRDGTLTYEDHRYHRDLTTVRPYPFVAGLLQQLAAAGAKLAVATNQSGIGRGLWSRAEVDALHDSLTRDWGVELAWHICPHLPDDGCDCRKPEAGLIQQAVDGHGIDPADALMIGDALTDAQAARSAGVDFALVLTGRGRAALPELGGQPVVLDTLAQLEMSRG